MSDPGRAIAGGAAERLTLDEAAKMVGVPARVIARLCDSGRMPHEWDAIALKRVLWGDVLRYLYSHHRDWFGGY